MSDFSDLAVEYVKKYLREKKRSFDHLTQESTFKPMTDTLGTYVMLSFREIPGVIFKVYKSGFVKEVL